MTNKTIKFVVFADNTVLYLDEDGRVIKSGKEQNNAN